MVVSPELEVISRDTIKPSSSTPHHLRKYQFSFLDQIAPPVFMPLVIFYPPHPHNMQRSIHLKHSLSKALTRFYPMAGRVINDLYIDCNDEGVPFVEARAHCNLLDVITDPIPSELNKFVPYELDDVRDLSLVIQVTFFDCGGMALGVGISHKIADALSFFMFVNSWAAVARGDRDSDIPTPRFESATLFPARVVTGFKPSTGIVKENISTKRFVFSASTIAGLRDRYTNSKTGDMRPTRIEALSVFIWSRFMAATESKLDSNKIHTVLHAVNLRTRVDPPLPANYFGNISRLAIAMPSVDDGEDKCYGIVNKMREAINNVNSGYVAKLREGDKHLNFIKERAKRVTNGEVVSFSFTSLCRFPLYEADFGWGKPIWVGSASLKFKNLIVFLDTQSGDEIEAWVNLKGEDMAKFEADKVLLETVSASSTGVKICGV